MNGQMNNYNSYMQKNYSPIDVNTLPYFVDMRAMRDYAKEKGAKVLIRGLRAVSDFEFEMQLSQTNSALDKDVKKIFLKTRPKYIFISSSSVKEVVSLGGDCSKFVPQEVNEYLKSKFKTA